MRTATLRLEDMKTTIINMGYVGENEHKQIRFDGKKMFDEYPNASVSLTVCPACGDAYPATIERDGDFVLWTITDSDLVAEGAGEVQLTFTESPHIAKSYICRTKVLRSLVPTGDIPSGLDDFITRADALLEELEDAIPEGGTTGQVLAKKSNDDFDTEWVDQTGGGGTGDYEDLTNKPQIGGVTLTGNKTLHDLGAATEEAVGAKYTKPSGGIPASDMADGVIPVLTDLIDDTAGDGDTDKVWSADKSADTVQSVLSEITSKMDEPESEGTSGQVLTTDGSGGRTWTTPSGGGSIDNVENLYEQLYEDIGYPNSSTGAITSYNSTYIEKTSKFIPVTAGETLHYQAWASGDPHGRIAYYNSSKEFVSSEDIASANRTSSYAHLDKAVPSGVSYIRFGYYSFGSGKACITRSSMKTEWVPALVDEGTKVYTSADEYDLKSINHRGYTNIAPENTLPAFILSKRYGFDMVETDVQFTSDNVPVILHDTTINRTARNADGTELSSDVAINSITFSDSQDYDFGIWKGSQYAGTKLPKFEDFIILCKQLGLHAYIELKNDVQYTEEQILSVIAIVKKYDMVENCTWISFSYIPLTVVKRNSPYSRIGFIVSTISEKRITEAKFLRTQYNETFIDANVANLTSELIALVKASGIPLETYGVTTETGMLALDDYISGVTADVYNFKEVVQNNLMPDQVSGSTPSITGIAGHRYICGECSTLSIVAPASGCIDVLFTSGSTATVLTVTSAKSNTTIKWANNFNPSSLDASTTYELSILDGEFGVSCSWT